MGRAMDKQGTGETQSSLLIKGDRLLTSRQTRQEGTVLQAGQSWDGVEFFQTGWPGTASLKRVFAGREAKGAG